MRSFCIYVHRTQNPQKYVCTRGLSHLLFSISQCRPSSLNITWATLKQEDIERQVELTLQLTASTPHKATCLMGCAQSILSAPEVPWIRYISGRHSTFLMTEAASQTPYEPRGLGTPTFFVTLFTTIKLQKQPKCPSMKESFSLMGYRNKGMLFTHKKQWDSALCNTCTNLDTLVK